MARLSSLPNTTLQSNLPIKDRLALALQFLHENPDEKPATAARLYKIEKEATVRQAWHRGRKRKGVTHGGHNKILRSDQHQALIKYAVDQATNGGKGATKQMMYNCAMWLRTQEG
jgi:hypothetical protein